MGDRGARKNLMGPLTRDHALAPLRLANFLHMRVIGVPPSAATTVNLTTVLAPGPRRADWASAHPRPWVLGPALLPAGAALLVAGPVFVQAPWVRQAPMAAALFTAVLLAWGILLERSDNAIRRDLGALLVGFAGSWLGGTLFWGWCRLHPLWHLPIEAFALPLAIAGLGGRWRLAGGFYLASLLGTAATDGAIALIGLMPSWITVLQASPDQALVLLQGCAERVLTPAALASVSAMALGLLALCRILRGRGAVGAVAAATLATTLAVDGLFLIAALLAPQLSGLV